MTNAIPESTRFPLSITWCLSNNTINIETRLERPNNKSGSMRFSGKKLALVHH